MARRPRQPQLTWWDAVRDAFRRVLIGFVLIAAGLPTMWCNEGRSVRTARSLEQGAGAVVEAPADHVDAAFDGKLVHMTGRATTSETVRDLDFGVAANGLKLARTVEMYQWQEKEQTGSDSKRHYSYALGWADREIDASGFHAGNYKNPGPLPWPSKTFFADRVALGAFQLTRAQIELIDAAERVPVDQAAAARLPANSGLRVADGIYYRGKDPASPQWGDVRIRYDVTRPLDVSVVAVQRGHSFEPFKAPAGDEVLLVDDGLVAAADMFASAQRENLIYTWFLRVAAMLMLGVGIWLVFGPVVEATTPIPIVGSLLRAGVGLFTLALTAIVSLVTMAAAWLFYRPVYAATLLAVAAAAFVWLRRQSGTRPQAAGAAS